MPPTSVAAEAGSLRSRLPGLARLATVLVLVGAAAVLLSDRFDIDAVHAQARRMPASVAFLLLLFLPLVGFPASVLHVAAGIRFGGPLGLLLVSVSIGFQLLVSHIVVRRWQRPFARRFGWLRRRIPEGAHASIAVFAVLLPGAPYAAINYVLPLVGVPLRTFLLCCWPIHTLRSTVTVLLGDQSDELTPARLTVLGVYALLLAAVSWWVYRRLRRQLEGRPQGAGGRMQPV